MFTITVETSFIAHHQLTLPDGTKEPLHDHDWKLIVAVSSEHLDQTGCVMDFHLLQDIINKTLSPLSGIALENLDYFAKNSINASAENVAKYIYDIISPQLPENINLSYINLMEAPDCWAKYTKS